MVASLQFKLLFQCPLSYFKSCISTFLNHTSIQESGYYCHGWLFSFVIISSFSLIFRLVLLMYSFIFLALTLATKSFLYQPNRPTPFQQQHME